MDEAGRVGVAGCGGGCVLCHAAGGQLEPAFEAPAPALASLCFAGPDRRGLIVVSAGNRQHPERGGTMFRTRIRVPGPAVPLAAI